MSAGQGHWADLPACQWQDWRWQLQNRITSLDQLQRLAPNLAPEEVVGALAARRKLAMSITPYFFNLIDFKDPRCPIRRQVIPRIEETQTAPGELKDPCDEDSHSPVPGLVHRYPDRVLMLVTDRCASYCRYCTRSRLVGRAASESFESRLDLQIDYIARTPAVRDVLLSGGDPLLLN
ncbi:MAG TPA: lysine 2,3-aminomutase, partial [Verrucomicrobiota bacterium]|nr:lysine 2,3-aminomutase [Verrucomicrobiota bacterium]